MVTADVSANKISVDDFDGIVIPGGYAPDMMRRFPVMVDLVKNADAADKVVAAICHTGWMLISAGILKNR